MPALGISIHRWRRCSERAQRCFPSNLFCTVNDFYISPSNCRDLGNLASYPLPSSNHRAPLTKQYPKPKLAAFITEVEDQMAEFAYSLEEQNRLLRSVYTKCDFSPICCRTKFHQIFDVSS